MPKTNESQVKEAILLAKNLSVARELRAAEALAAVDSGERATLDANRRDAQRLLADAIPKHQVDLERFERIHAKHQVEMNQLHEARRVVSRGVV